MDVALITHITHVCKMLKDIAKTRPVAIQDSLPELVLIKQIKN